MISWLTIRPALVTLIGSIANDLAMTPQWDQRVQAFESPTLQQSVFLRVNTVVTEGADMESYEEDPGDSSILHESTSGHRLITLQIKCDSFVDKDGEWSFQTAERIRTRLRRRSSTDALLALGMCLVETFAAVGGTYENDGHLRNTVVFDAVFRCTFNDVSTDPADYWSQVLLTSNIKHGDGSSVSSPPNFTDEQVP